MLLMTAMISCAGLAEMETPVETGIDVAEQYAPLVDTVTNGWASVIVKIFGALAGAIFAINRALVAKDRKNVIIEVHQNPNTPDIALQATTDTVKKTISKIIK